MKSIAAAYQAGELEDFFRLQAGDLGSAAQETRNVDRQALAAALREYHRELGTLDANVQAQLARLEHPASRVIVAGQQAGLLTGPAYSVHKGADAVLLARQLDKPEAPVVALYWIASQDHDAAEVASVTLLDHAETLHRLTLDLPQGVPIGRIPWQEDWTKAVLELLERFDTAPEYRQSVRQRLEQAIQLGRSYADVFARLMHGLLGSAGLVMLDPMHPAIARLMVPALERELGQPLASSERIEAAAEQLKARGFEPQLRRPARATNLFVEEEDGQRRLLRFQEGTFQTDTRRYGREELQSLLEAHPNRVTPAAGVRPVVQDSILPTLALILGPGEIGYIGQMRQVYELHGLQQPLLWSRLSVTWLEPNVARILDRFGISAGQFQRDPEGILGQAIAREQGHAALAAAQIERLHNEFKVLTEQIAALDPTLQTSAERTQRSSLEHFQRLQDKATRALARQEEVKNGQLTRLKLHLLPLGHPQEREMCFLTYLLKHGQTPLRLLLEQQAGAKVEIRIP